MKKLCFFTFHILHMVGGNRELMLIVMNGIYCRY